MSMLTIMCVNVNQFYVDTMRKLTRLTKQGCALVYITCLLYQPVDYLTTLSSGYCGIYIVVSALLNEQKTSKH